MSENQDLSPIDHDPRASENQVYNVRNREQWPGAVLLADEIAYYCTQVEPKMINPFHEEQLRPASYQLRLGEDIRIEGETKKLDDEAGVILNSHGVVVVSTEEVLSIPRFLIARWSLRVRKNYQGLLWTGGLAVDPGWMGQLHCPIYNLSDQPVTLRHNDAFFTMDFVRTTAITDEYLELRDREETRRTWYKPSPRKIEEDDIHGLRSAPLRTEDRLDEIDKRVSESGDKARLELEQLRSEVRQEITQFRGIGLALIAILFTALGAVVAAIAASSIDAITPSNGVLLSKWPMVALIASAASFVPSILALVLSFYVLRKVMEREK